MFNAIAMNQEDIERIEHTLFFEQPNMRQRMIRFTALILFASIIATCGLLSDSVASIIGAMIIAPLMTPLMGIVVAIVIGSGDRAIRCLVIAVIGIVLAIATGWLIAWLMPYGWDPLASAQVLSRTEPKLLDLVVALASGGAGAYALSRPDVADALPGVAIAISLVPPLNTVGILLAGGEYHLAKGAMLLFVTNFTAILLAGAVTFVITGLAAGAKHDGPELRTSLIGILLLALLVSVPLMANSNHLWTDTRREQRARGVVSSWLDETGWELVEVDVDGSSVNLVLAGSGDVPDTSDVVPKLRDIMGEDMSLTARVVDMRKINLVGSPAAETTSP